MPLKSVKLFEGFMNVSVGQRMFKQNGPVLLKFVKMQ